MGDFMGGIFSIALIVFMCFCTVVVPVVSVQSYFEKRGCQVVAQKECHWQMLPAEGSDNE